MEGPSLIIIKEELRKFRGKKVRRVEGNSKAGIETLEGLTIRDIKSWGKHLLIIFSDRYVRIHFLMFGSYRIDENKDRPPALHLGFINGFVNFYSSSIKIFEGSPDDVYDWTSDLLSDSFSIRKAVNKIRKLPKVSVSDVLLDQDILSGSGNIIKNEVLYRLRLHPETRAGKLSGEQIKSLVAETRQYSFDFLKWKRVFQLSRNWQIYKRKKCPRCNGPVRLEYTGAMQRRTFYCPSCQRKPRAGTAFL